MYTESTIGSMRANARKDSLALYSAVVCFEIGYVFRVLFRVFRRKFDTGTSLTSRLVVSLIDYFDRRGTFVVINFPINVFIHSSGRSFFPPSLLFGGIYFRSAVASRSRDSSSTFSSCYPFDASSKERFIYSGLQIFTLGSREGRGRRDRAGRVLDEQEKHF